MGSTRGSGNVKTETRQISGISAVELDTSGDLTLSQGETESLTIEAEDNLLPLLTSDVSNGALTLGTKPNTSISATKPIKYTLVVKNLSSLMLNGSGNIAAGDLTATDKFTVESNGSGNIVLASLSASATTAHLAGSGALNVSNMTSTTISVIIDGSGDAQITGTAAGQKINVNGSGDFNGEKLAGKTAVINTNGSGRTTVQVSDTLNAIINGSGDIIYIGNPTVTQSHVGSGRVSQKS